MSLSLSTVKRLMTALASQPAGIEVADAINQGSAGASQDAIVVPAAITATNVSTTIDFGALAVGDLLVHIPATPGNAGFEAIVTAGTKPSAAVVGDLYIVLRAFAAPASNSSVKL